MYPVELIKKILYVSNQGWIQRFGKEGMLYGGHHGWPTKKILVFRWSKKAKIILETITSRRNISISIFKFSPMRKETQKSWTYNLQQVERIRGCFLKPLLKLIYFFFFFFFFRKHICSPISSFLCQDDAKRGNWVRQITRNDKLQYSFQK